MAHCSVPKLREGAFRVKNIAIAVKQYVEAGKYAHYRRVLTNARNEGYTAGAGDLEEATTLAENMHRAERAAFARGFKAAYARRNE